MSVIYDFSGKRYVVTGASSGIGRQIVRDLATAGASVLAVARRGEALNDVASEHPDAVVPAPVDVKDFSELKTAITGFAQSGVIHGSVHAAGENRFTPLRALDWDAAEGLLRTHLLAGIELIRLLSSRRLAAAGSSHVQLASVAGWIGQPGLVAYGASKAAVIGAVRSLAKELAPRRVRVNALSPGWVRTPMAASMEAEAPGLEDRMGQVHPLGLGEPADVSMTALFLLSDAARWITGANIVVDGGYSS